MMKLLHTLLSVFLFVGLTGCGSTMEGIGSALSNMTGSKKHNGFEGRYIDQQEVAEFKQRNDALSGKGRLISYDGLDIPANQIRQSHIVHSPELNRYLTAILDKVTAQWNGTPVNIQVQVIHSQNFAPYADAYGMISMPLGALANIESEDELALMLAHEVSHIVLRHHERESVVTDNNDNINTLSSAFIMANIIKDSKFDKDGEDLFAYHPTNHGQKNISKAAIYGGIIQTVSTNVWNTAWKRNQEDEADLLALDMALAAGYSPRASAHVLQRLADFQGKQKSLLSKYWKYKKASISSAFQSADLSQVNAQIDSALDEGMNAALGTVTDYFQRSHMSPEDRDLSAREYVRREYGDHIRRRVDKQSWQAFSRQENIASLIYSYRQAFEAANALAENDLATAETLAFSALTPEVSGHPYIREVLYNLRMAQNNPAKAAQNLTLITHWEHASPTLFDTRIELDMAHQNYAQVLDSIAQAEAVFGNRSRFIVQKSIALTNLGRQQEAIAELEKCSLYNEVQNTCKQLLDRLNRAT